MEKWTKIIKGRKTAISKETNTDDVPELQRGLQGNYQNITADTNTLPHLSFEKRKYHWLAWPIKEYEEIEVKNELTIQHQRSQRYEDCPYNHIIIFRLEKRP